MGLLRSFVFVLLANAVYGNFAHEFNKTTPFTKVLPISDSSDLVYITPELVFVGKSNGEIDKCLFRDPSVCETFYSAGSPITVTSTVISGEYMYASLANGLMIKCNLQEEQCVKFNTISSRINSLAVSNGYIYVGQNRQLQRCSLHLPENCQSFKVFLSGVTSLGASDKYIYVGLDSKQLWRCSVVSKGSCQLINPACESTVQGISVVDETVFVVTASGTFWNCTRGVPCTNTVYTRAPGTQFTSMAVFDASLYALHNSEILVCKLDTLSNCTSYAQHEGAVSVSFGYSTYKMQERFVNEEKTCLFGVRCPPFIIYYEISQRTMLEVFIKDGKLYNSQNVLVDTTNADAGQSGRAAIFAMSADGQILLSNVHSTHDSVLRTSSLFAGHPVAGAGEMVVENGVVKSIRACSDHYRPTVELNQQVINALRLKGYTNRIDNLPCCRGNECQVDEEENTNGNNADLQYRHYTPHRSLIISSFLVGVIMYAFQELTARVDNTNMLRFYASHFVLNAIKPALLLRLAPSLAMLPFTRKEKID